MQTELRETRNEQGWRLELVRGDETVSWAAVIDRQIRIGQALVRVGGIGGVGTRSEHRRQGYSRRVMEAAVALMEREAYDLSLLHGIQDFYHRYGYVTCMAEHDLWLETRDAERAGKGVRMRRARPADTAAIARLYNRENGASTGSAWRDPGTWQGIRLGTWWSIRAQVQVAVADDGTVLGYVAYDDIEDRCHASEVGGSGAAVYAAILRFLAQRAVRLRVERVWLNLPAGHPFAIYCRQFGLHATTLYPRNQKHMGRIIDLPSTMRKVLPELARRWGAEQRDRRLSLRTDLGSATLRWQEGALGLSGSAGRQAVRLSQQALTQLLLGYVRPSDLRAMCQAEIPAVSRDLMERLFPLQEAHLWWADRF